MRDSKNAIARFFRFSSHRTQMGTEMLAGMTTFLTMAYILIVNPDILSNAIFLDAPRDLFNELVVATAVSVAIATFIMGCLANYPFALAPGLGLNAFFAFSVVLGLGIDWRLALSAIFLEGLIFIALTLTEVRRQMVEAIPHCLKHATAAGIGLFIAYIALSEAEIIVASEATLTTLGDFTQPRTFIPLLGTLITAALVARRLRGALLAGILATAALSWILGITPFPEGIIAFPSFPSHLFGQAFVGFALIGQISVWDFLAVLFVFLFVDLFDTIGTLTGVGTQAGYITRSGELPKANQALLADAVGTTVGAILGTSTVTTYIESAAGVSEGGRTGFTAVVVALLFLLSLFFIPLISAVPTFATVPALLIVGVLMMGNVRSISWDDPAESIPAFLTMIMMPLSYSIAEGLAFGFIAYPLIKAYQGKGREVGVGVWVLAGIFVLRFVLQAFSVTE